MEKLAHVVRGVVAIEDEMQDAGRFIHTTLWFKYPEVDEFIKKSRHCVNLSCKLKTYK